MKLQLNLSYCNKIHACGVHFKINIILQYVYINYEESGKLGSSITHLLLIVVLDETLLEVVSEVGSMCELD